LLATGIAAAFVGLVVNLLLLAVEMGATTNVANTATYSAWMHTMRLLGGEIGAVIFSHFLAVREQLHSNMLGQHVDAGNWIADDRVRNLALALAPSSAGLEEAQAREATIVGGQVRAHCAHAGVFRRFPVDRMDDWRVFTPARVPASRHHQPAP
jgi:DHA2 family multidrug resistance protein